MPRQRFAFPSGVMGDLCRERQGVLHLVGEMFHAVGVRNESVLAKDPGRCTVAASDTANDGPYGSVGSAPVGRSRDDLGRQAPAQTLSANTSPRRTSLALSLFSDSDRIRSPTGRPSDRPPTTSTVPSLRRSANHEAARSMSYGPCHPGGRSRVTAAVNSDTTKPSRSASAASPVRRRDQSSTNRSVSKEQSPRAIDPPYHSPRGADTGGVPTAVLFMTRPVPSTAIPFPLHETANNAEREAHRYGRVSSWSCRVR